MLFGRKRKFIFVVQEMVISPTMSFQTSHCNCGYWGGWAGIKPRAFACQAHVVPTEPHPQPASAIALTMSPAFLFWYGAGDALMHADGVIAHCQWPTPSPLPRLLFPPPTLSFLCLFWGVNSGSLSPILLDKCSTSELHLQPPNNVQCY